MGIIDQPKLSCPDPIAGCNGKTRHDSSAAAHTAKQRLKKRHTSPGDYKVYKCEFCGGWHLAGSYNMRRVRGK